MVKNGGQGMKDFQSFAMDLIHLAGQEALSYFGKGDKEVKFDEALVTESELRLTEMFQKKLRERFPEHRVFPSREENPEYTHEESRFLWIFDPLDGVSNFQAGIPLWGISLALFDNYWPVFGVFSMPSANTLFQARAGGKAYWNDREIRISTQENIDNESLLFTYSRFHRHFRTSFPGKIRNLGCTAAHICFVAMGRAEAAVISNESYQNLAAASIIIESAGGKIFKMDGQDFVLGEYLDSKKGGDFLVVVGPDAFQQVRKNINPILE